MDCNKLMYSCTHVFTACLQISMMSGFKIKKYQAQYEPDPGAAVKKYKNIKLLEDSCNTSYGSTPNQYIYPTKIFLFSLR